MIVYDHHLVIGETLRENDLNRRNDVVPAIVGGNEDADFHWLAAVDRGAFAA